MRLRDHFFARASRPCSPLRNHRWISRHDRRRIGRRGPAVVQSLSGFLNVIRKITTFDQLHDIVMQAMIMSCVKDRNDIGVLQMRRGLSFVLESKDLASIHSPVQFQRLNCHGTFQVLLNRSIDDSHSSVTDLAENREAGNLREGAVWISALVPWNLCSMLLVRHMGRSRPRGCSDGGILAVFVCCTRKQLRRNHPKDSAGVRKPLQVLLTSRYDSRPASQIDLQRDEFAQQVRLRQLSMLFQQEFDGQRGT